MHTVNQFTPDDIQYMQLALSLAQQGALLGEVPVGAVLVSTETNTQDTATRHPLTNSHILGQGYNQPIASHDPTAHAEIVALRQACQQLNNYRLPANSTLYVTLEPCTMCVGALIHARLQRLVFATHEPRAGMVISQANLLNADFYNHKIHVQSGLLADESSALLKAFFKARRRKSKKRGF